MASLVVPGVADTIAAFLPARWFSRLLFPTLGGPTMATLAPLRTMSPLDPAHSNGSLARGSALASHLDPSKLKAYPHYCCSLAALQPP